MAYNLKLFANLHHTYPVMYFKKSASFADLLNISSKSSKQLPDVNYSKDDAAVPSTARGLNAQTFKSMLCFITGITNTGATAVTSAGDEAKNSVFYTSDDTGGSSVRVYYWCFVI